MKVLVYPHDLEIGGSQINAIELAAAVAAQGDEVIVFGYPGTLVSYIEELGLDFVTAPRPRRRPSPTTVLALRKIVRERQIDVLHGYEWPPALECWLAAGLTRKRSIGTVMSMSVADFLSFSVPLIVGTDQIAAAERESGRKRVATLEPPVDLSLNSPTFDSGVAEFREQWDIDPATPTVVMVSRLSAQLKLEGVLAAIDAFGEMSAISPVQLVIVGDGPARDTVRSRAQTVNNRVPGTIVLTGAAADPRPAYAAADLSLGMGGSALRACAFGNPVVVQGEQGYWQLLDAESVDEFLWSGWYGVGTGSATGSRLLIQILTPLLHDAIRLKELGEFAMGVVSQRFSLTEAAAKQQFYYEDALTVTTPWGLRIIDALRSVARYARYFTGREVARFRGRAAEDDFNSSPVAAERSVGKAIR